MKNLRWNEVWMCPQRLRIQRIVIWKIMQNHTQKRFTCYAKHEFINFQIVITPEHAHSAQNAYCILILEITSENCTKETPGNNGVANRVLINWFDSCEMNLILWVRCSVLIIIIINGSGVCSNWRFSQRVFQTRNGSTPIRLESQVKFWLLPRFPSRSGTVTHAMCVALWYCGSMDTLSSRVFVCVCVILLIPSVRRWWGVIRRYSSWIVCAHASRHSLNRNHLWRDNMFNLIIQNEWRSVKCRT